jgi:hypothetical protein
MGDIFGGDGEISGDDTQAGADEAGATQVSETAGEELPGDAAPTRFDKVRRSGAGVIMTGIALGLQDALELPKKEPAFVIKATGEPDGDPGPIDLQFDPDDPSNTVAVIRPWLADGKKDRPPN